MSTVFKGAVCCSLPIPKIFGATKHIILYKDGKRWSGQGHASAARLICGMHLGEGDRFSECCLASTVCRLLWASSIFGMLNCKKIRPHFVRNLRLGKLHGVGFVTCQHYRHVVGWYTVGQNSHRLSWILVHILLATDTLTEWCHKLFHNGIGTPY